MRRLGVIGASWRDGQAAERFERFAIPAEQRGERLPSLAASIGARELVYLGTCNRVEIVFVAEEGSPISVYRPRVFRQLCGQEPRPGESVTELRAWGGEGAAEHLFRLAAGLESAMLGEREIVAQMREGLDEARRAGTVGPILEWLFQEAWKVGRRVHTSTGVGEGKVSLGMIAVERARERLDDHDGAVVLIGVSPMTEYCARALADLESRLWICNRTREKADELAARQGARSISLEEFRREPPGAIAAIVLATGAPEPVLSRADLERVGAASVDRPPLLIDMATPPDVDPAAARDADLPRIGLDEIIRETEAHRVRRKREGAAAAELVEQALEGLEDKLVAGVLSPLLAALQRDFRETARRGLDRLLKSELPEVEDVDLERLQRWADVLARRFAHLPTVGLKSLAKSHGLEAVEAFLTNSGGALEEELERIRSDDQRLLPRGVEQEIFALREPGR